MADTTASPNMSMPVPVVGTDPGPDWANNVNACLSIIDGHTHTAGSGVQLTPDSLNINTDLPMNDNNLTSARSVRFQPQSAALALPADVGCIYEAGVDLYYNDGAGNQIRLTQSGSIVGTAGSISGLPSGTASASYNAGAGSFVWQSATNIGADTDTRSVILRNNVANSKGLTLSPPNAMGTNYSLILPTLPGALSFLTIDTSGNIGSSLAFNNVQLNGLSPGPGSDILNFFKDWTDWSGSLVAAFSGNGPSTITIDYAIYTQTNKTISMQLSFTIVTRVFTTGTDVLTITLPAVSDTNFNRNLGTGTWTAQIDSKFWDMGMNTAFSTTTPALTTNRASSTSAANIINLTPSNTSDGDNFILDVTYKTV